MRVEDYLKTQHPLIADLLQRSILALPFTPSYMVWTSQVFDKEKVKQGLVLAKDEAAMREMHEWCASEIKGKYQYNATMNYTFFELQEDAMHFTLRWG